MKRLFILFYILSIFFLCGNAMAAFIYDESVSGDLSGVFSSPDTLSFASGSNTVIGSVGTNGNTGATNGSDADYFAFKIANGFLLSSITVESYSGPDTNPSFIAYRAGTGFAGQGSGDIDDWELFNGTSGDILDDLAGTILGAGDYAFWLQQTASGTYNYELSFQINAVPIPGAVWLFGTGLIGLLGLRRKFKK